MNRASIEAFMKLRGSRKVILESGYSLFETLGFFLVRAAADGYMKVTWRESKIPGDILGRRFSGVDSGMQPPEDSDFFDVPHSHACTSAFAHPRLIKEICRRGLKGWVDVDVVNSVFSQFEANFQECPDVVKRYNRYCRKTLSPSGTKTSPSKCAAKTLPKSTALSVALGSSGSPCFCGFMGCMQRRVTKSARCSSAASNWRPETAVGPTHSSPGNCSRASLSGSWGALIATLTIGLKLKACKSAVSLKPLSLMPRPSCSKLKTSAGSGTAAIMRSRKRRSSLK